MKNVICYEMTLLFASWLGVIWRANAMHVSSIIGRYSTENSYRYVPALGIDSSLHTCTYFSPVAVTPGPGQGASAVAFVSETGLKFFTLTLGFFFSFSSLSCLSSKLSMPTDHSFFLMDQGGHARFYFFTSYLRGLCLAERLGEVEVCLFATNMQALGL